MAAQIRMHQWEEWQSYRKDRGAPPWIKVHRNLLTNQKWVQLTDAEKGQLVSMWIVAADTNGVLPDNPLVLRKMCSLDEAPNLQKFKALCWVTPIEGQSDVKVTPTWRQHDAPETETETETESETELEADKPQRQKPKQKAKRHANPARSLGEVIADNNGQPPAEWGEWAHQRFGWDADRISTEWEEFGPNFWLTGNCLKYDGGRKSDWFATWRNHCLKADKRGGSGRAGGKANGGYAAAIRFSVANRHGMASADSILRGGGIPDATGPDGSGAFNPDGSPIIPF